MGLGKYSSSNQIFVNPTKKHGDGVVLKAEKGIGSSTRYPVACVNFKDDKNVL